MTDLILSAILGGGIATVVMAIVFWLSKSFIVQYINNYVGHEFTKRTESYKAELQGKHQEQQHFHEILKQALSDDNKELKTRKIVAADSLWKSLVSMKKFNFAVKSLGTLDFDKIKQRADDPKIQAFLNSYQGCSFEGLTKEAEAAKEMPAELARPWVTYRAWSLYLAYTTIIYYTVCQFESAKVGGALDKVFDENKMVEVLQNALPQITITKIFPELLGQMHDMIEFELLVELKNIIEAKEDAAAIVRAQEVSNAVAVLKQNAR